MANEKVTARVWLQKNKFTFLLAALIISLVAVLVGAGISLAKYTSNAKGTKNEAAVGAFVPTITYGEDWYDENGDLQTNLLPGTPTSPKKYSFVVTNDVSATPICVVVELTVEQVLPLNCDLYMLTDEGEMRLEPDTEGLAGDTRTYTCVLKNAERANFFLVVSWLEGERDERFNGLTNDIRMTVVCEQTQTGGAE